MPDESNERSAESIRHEYSDNRLLFVTIALLWIYAAFAVPLG